MRDILVAAAANDIMIAHEVVEALRGLRLLDPECERLVFRIRAEADAVLSATNDELEDLIGGSGRRGQS